MKTEARKDENYSKLLLGEGNYAPVDDQGVVLQLPDWADKDKIEIGRKFFFSNINSMLYSLIMGLLAIPSSNPILKILMNTKQSSSTLMAYRRYKANILHTQLWFVEPLEPGTKAWKSLETIRKMHVFMSRKATGSGIGMISQKEMAVTLFLYNGFAMLKPESFGIIGSREQFEALNHFWRVIGSMLGVEDRFSCFGETVEETRGRLEVIRQDIMRPGLQFAPPEYWSYTRTAASGMWHFNQLLHYDSMMWMMRRAVGLPGFFYFDSESDGHERNFDNLTLYTRLRIFLDIIVYEYLSHIFIFKWLFNTVRIIEALFNIYPITAVITFGRKNGVVEILKGKS